MTPGWRAEPFGVTKLWAACHYSYLGPGRYGGWSRGFDVHRYRTKREAEERAAALNAVDKAKRRS